MPRKGKRRNGKKRRNRVNNESLLLGLPREIFYHILDFTCPEYNGINIDEFILPTSDFKKLMLVNKKMRQLMIFYIKKRYNLFDFFSNEDINFEPNKRILTLLDKHLTSVIDEKARRAASWCFPSYLCEIDYYENTHLGTLCLFLEFLKKSIGDKNMLKKIRLSGQFIANLYLKGLELFTGTPKETINRMIGSGINFDFPNLYIYFNGMNFNDMHRIINETIKITYVFSIYSKLNVGLLWEIPIGLNFNVGSIKISIYRGPNFIPANSYISDLLFTTIGLNKFYIDTLDNRIDSSKIISSIVNKRIEPILLHLPDIFNLREFKIMLLKFGYIFEKNWKLLEDDYLSIIWIFKKNNSRILRNPIKTIDIDKLDIKCGLCGRLLNIEPYYADYDELYYVPSFSHYFCYLYQII